MKRFILSLICLNILFTSALFAKVVDFKWKLNKNFVLNAYKKDFDSLVGTASETPESAFKRALHQDIIKVLVINKKLIGFVECNKKHAIIDGIYVHPQFRGKGHAKTLLNYAENYFRKKGAKQVKMEVYAFNKKALSAFKKAGYSYKGGWAKQKGNHLIELIKKLK